MMELFKLDPNKKRFYKNTFYGTLLMVTAFAIFLSNPLKLIVDQQLTIVEGSLLFRLWKQPPLDVYISVYIFNITNAAEFLNGTHSKLKLQDVGPFVFREFLVHENITFNDNGTITYVPVRSHEFVPERSIGNPTELVVHVPNIPLLGVSSTANDISMWAALAVNTLAKTVKSQPILNLTIHDYFWGYDDSIVSLASTFVPHLIKFNKFGIMDRMFDEDEDEVTVNLPERKQIEKIAKTHQFEETPLSEYLIDTDNEYESKIAKRDTSDEATNLTDVPIPIRDYSIDKWNGKGGLEHWGYKTESDKMNDKNTPCNTLQGAYDGTLFPKNFLNAEKFLLYRKSFCRTLKIEYSHPGIVDGVDVSWFHLARDAFHNDLDDPSSACYCNDGKCLQQGLGDITPCYYNMPAAVSLPHFYKSDPSLLEGVDGLSPDPEKHESKIAIQKQLGVPIKVNTRIQLNLVMGPTRFNTQIKPFDNTVVPIIWCEIAVEGLTSGLKMLLHALFKYFPPTQIAIIYILGLSGLMLLIYGILSFWLRRQTYEHNNENVKYSAVKVVPKLKKYFENYDIESYLH